jgi:signal transduction histidine kinase
MDEWLRMSSHALKGQVATLSYAVQTLGFRAETAPDPRQREVLAMMSDATANLASTTDRVVLFLRLELATLPVEWQRRGVPAIVDAASREAGGPWSQRASVAGAIPGVEIDCIPALATTALVELFRNAGRFGAGRLEVSAVAVDGRVDFLVRDEGDGIEAKDRARVFEPFFRGTNRSHGAGPGLGLAIVDRIARLHGGAASLESGQPGDTRFRLGFPVERPLSAATRAR